MRTMSADREALLRSLDREDWSVLPILADLLLDEGDEDLSEGLRRVGNRRPIRLIVRYGFDEDLCFGWVFRAKESIQWRHSSAAVPHEWRKGLEGSLREEDEDYYATMAYTSRSEALLDLASFLDRERLACPFMGEGVEAWA